MVDVLMRRAIVAAALILLAGCGGGGGGGATAVPSTPKQPGTVQKTITLVVPGYNPSKSVRSQYVSRNTQGIGISYGASPFTFPAVTTPVSAFDVSLGGGQCTVTNATTGARTCTLTIGAPVGADDFQVTAWDSVPVGGRFTSGSELSTVTLLSQAVASGVNTPLNLTLNGIVTSVNTSVSPSTISAAPTGSAPVTATVSVNALDADGNVIMDNGSNWIDGNGNVLTITVGPCVTANGGPMVTSPSAPTGVTPAAPTFTVTYSGGATWGTSFPLTITGTASVIPTSAATLNVAPSMTTFAIPTSGAQINGMALGPDGNVWFTEASTAKVGFITPAGAITELPTLTFFPTAVPAGITAASDGNMYWLDASGTPKLEYVAPPGTATINSASLPPSGWIPNQIIQGPDGNLWFTQDGAGNVGMGINGGGIQVYNMTNHTISNYSIPAYGVNFNAIALGPDGNLWYPEVSGGALIAETFSGGVQTGFSSNYSVTTPATDQPFGVAAGSDGNVWFTAQGGAYVGVMTTGGSLTHTYPTPIALGKPGFMVNGTDGALWFAGRGPTNPGAGGIGRITTSGIMTSYFSNLGAADDPLNIVVGANGYIWFGEPSANKIGRLIY